MFRVHGPLHCHPHLENLTARVKEQSLDTSHWPNMLQGELSVISSWGAVCPEPACSAKKEREDR